jgi:hypothetical protein
VTGTRDLYLDVAAAAADLLASPAVAAAWREPSALAKMSVQGLAGHLSYQVFSVRNLLEAPEPSEPVVPIHEYYARVAWIGSDVTDEFNTGIRANGEREAAAGPADLAARVAATVAELRAALPTIPPARPIRQPTWGAWSVTLDDMLASRMLELVIHGDDLAVSVGVPTPDYPPAAYERVVDILTRIAIRRHGPVNVLRALSRAERAPTTIAAL